MKYSIPAIADQLNRKLPNTNRKINCGKNRIRYNNWPFRQLWVWNLSQAML